MKLEAKSNTDSVSVHAYLRSGSVQKRLSELTANPGRFTASIMSAIDSNPVIADCDPSSVLTAGLQSEGLGLPVSPSLGRAYIVPYNCNIGTKDKPIWVKKAQFQIGYKGIIDLAQRSGLFRTINVTDVRKGEYKGEDRLSGQIEFKWIKSDDTRAKREVLGYVAYFKLTNGFEKQLYMKTEEIEKHAKKYSKSYQKGWGLWVSDWEMMASKTVLKLLLTRYGSLTPEMQQAIESDQSVVVGDSYDYVDNKKESTENIVEGEVVNE